MPTAPNKSTAKSPTNEKMSPLDTSRWLEIIEERLADDDVQRSIDVGKRSVAWYKNEGQYDKTEVASKWGGDTVRGNLWNRNVRTMKAAILGEEPRITVQSTLRDAVMKGAAAAISAMVAKTAKETKTWDQIKIAYVQAKHTGLGHCRLVWDVHRGLPRFDWCEGQVLWDSNGQGLPERSRWVAEILDRSLSEVLIDTTFPEKARKRLKTLMMVDDNELEYNRKIKVTYIWSKRGRRPWTKPEGRKLIVVCAEMEDEPLLVAEWPWPFLDLDEFPIKMMRLDSMPGDQYGALDFQTIESLLTQYNWLSTFMQASIRKGVTKKVLHTDQIKDPKQLTSGKHYEAIPVEGKDVSKVMEVVDFSGTGAAHAMQALEMVKGMYDEQTGHTDIVRGQALGGRTTAEETRTLNKNASLIFQDEGTTVDEFLNEVVRTLALAIIYYVPQWSRVVGEKLDEEGEPVPGQKEFITKVWDELSQTWVFQAISDEETAELRPVGDYPLQYVARAGVDAWVGDAHAEAWLEYDLDQLRRDFSFNVEAGTSRSSNSEEDQRKALSLYSTLGPVYQEFGFMEQWLALVDFFVKAHRIPDSERFIPTIEQLGMMASFVPQEKPNKQSTTNNTPGTDAARPDQQPTAQRQGVGFQRTSAPQPNGSPDADGLERR